MVSPVILLAASLGIAFLYPLLERAGRTIALGVASLSVLAFFGIAASWIAAIAGGAQPLIVDTAGFPAPLSINLGVGITEAIAIAVVSILALAGLITETTRRERPWEGKQVVLFFVLLLGSYGLILTRDLFNVFVFMEISGISVFGLLGTSRDERAFEAGFKYMIASGLASAFFLIGTAFIYSSVGSLNIADITTAAGTITGAAGIAALAFLLAGILVELKPAPANGWALDTYQAADPGLAALLSAVNATAMVVVFNRLLPLFTGAAPALFVPLILTAGIAAFIVPQVQALVQSSFRRLLGYSSVAQIGLVVIALIVRPAAVSIGGIAIPAAFVLLINHAVAKAGLFWLADATGDDRSGYRGESGTVTGLEALLPQSLRSRPAVLVVAGVMVCALLGLPPFPGFWAKWNLVMALGDSGYYVALALLLLGSLGEAVYLLRWFIAIARTEGDAATTVTEVIPQDFADASSGADAPAGISASSVVNGEKRDTAMRLFAPALAALLLAVAAGGLIVASGVGMVVSAVAAIIVVFGILDLLRIPVKLQVVAGILVVAGGAYAIVPQLQGAPRLFALIFAGGAGVQLVVFLNRRGTAVGLVAMIVGMVASLLALTVAESALAFFVAWEFMTLTSFFLVLRGARSAAAALRYVTFSLAGAFAMLAAFALPGSPFALIGEGGIATLRASAVTVSMTNVTPAVLWSIVLFALALLVKLGTVGLHIWLPPAYAETEDDLSAMMSSVLSKAGIFVLMTVAGIFAAPVIGSIDLNTLIGWLGVGTALVGAMMALFQEDIKYTLAYSSMSQIGYIVLSFAAMTHLGWVSGLYLTVTHLLFKGMLFLGIAGVVFRTGTRLMYQMGGLIKRMPLTFISVLIGIIAVSGVPPLSGFGGKWLLYTSLLERGWYLQAALALFSSGIAFLYLFRLIHSIFLGQRKAEHDSVREAPVAFLIPQYLFIVAIMAISMFPNVLIVPLQQVVDPIFPSSVVWEGYSVISALGYWNGNAVMYVTMGVFILPLIWLFLVKGRVYRVEQFNIVYAAERPYTPETTHYAFNFFGHYRKAFGRLLDPWGQRFWSGAVATTATVSRGLRGWNTGNPQTYALQIVLYLVVIFLLVRGGR